VFKDFLKLFGVKEFAPSGLLTKFFAQAICGHQWAHCDDLIFLLCGFDTSNLNQTRLPVYLSHTPAGTSVRDVYHYAEEYKSGKFQMYDFGSPEANAEHYQGMTTPPLYNLTDFHVPVYTYAGSNDWIADPEDVYSLLPQLKSLKRSITIEGYNHMDFIWGINANEKLYEDIIQNAKSLL
jgi:pimeloyl-ACP methyl ester carboxylesterase